METSRQVYVRQARESDDLERIVELIYKTDAYNLSLLV